MTEEVRTDERIKHSLNSFRLSPKRVCINFQAVRQIRYMYEQLFFLCRLLNILQTNYVALLKEKKKKLGSLGCGGEIIVIRIWMSISLWRGRDRGTIAGACLEQRCHVNNTREPDPWKRQTLMSLFNLRWIKTKLINYGALGKCGVLKGIQIWTLLKNCTVICADIKIISCKDENLNSPVNLIRA